MRSVFAHLIGVTREAVASRLSEIADPSGDEWFFPPGDAAKTVYLRLYDSLVIESEPEDLESLQAALGTLPEVSVMADISGRIPGDAEAREIVALLLRPFKGVAWDSYTSHCWTLAEIETDAEVCGHRFFDCTGWHAATLAQRARAAPEKAEANARQNSRQ